MRKKPVVEYSSCNAVVSCTEKRLYAMPVILGMLQNDLKEKLFTQQFAGNNYISKPIPVTDHSFST